MIYMLKKRFYILLFFCLLLGGNVNSSTVDKGDNNAPFENKSTETDYLPIADPLFRTQHSCAAATPAAGTCCAPELHTKAVSTNDRTTTDPFML